MREYLESKMFGKTFYKVGKNWFHIEGAKVENESILHYLEKEYLETYKSC